MESEWVPRRYTAKAATTRPTHVIGQDHLVTFTRDALESMAEQFRRDFIATGFEHLTYVPPLGRWYDGEVVDSEDGASELIVMGRELPQFLPKGDDPDPLAVVNSFPYAPVPADIPVTIHLEPRNFDKPTLKEIRETCPFLTAEELRWSALPPIEWVLTIPVLWGAVRFVGSFFDELGRTSAVAFVAWVKRLSSKSREPQRDGLVTIAFSLDKTRVVYGVVPIPHYQVDAGALLKRALDTSGPLAAFAGAQKDGTFGSLPNLVQAAFVFDEDGWHFAWWTDGEKVYRTHWFETNAPDPSRFTGHPPFGDPS